MFGSCSAQLEVLQWTRVVLDRVENVLLVTAAGQRADSNTLWVTVDCKREVVV